MPFVVLLLAGNLSHGNDWHARITGEMAHQKAAQRLLENSEPLGEPLFQQHPCALSEIIRTPAPGYHVSGLYLSEKQTVDVGRIAGHPPTLHFTPNQHRSTRRA